jgi:hypothetical protein
VLPTELVVCPATPPTVGVAVGALPHEVHPAVGDEA